MSNPQPLDERLGRHVETPVGGEVVRAFVPPPLPPIPPIDVLPLLPKLSAAERALGRLDGITVLLPRQELFLYMYVRKEAVLSSQIEGTQSTLSDLLRFETEAQAGEPIDDISEVSNYVDAMMYGLERLGDLPLSLRLIREMHERLLRSGRGGTKSPGEFRRSQNWVGGTRPGNAIYVPPPVSQAVMKGGNILALHLRRGPGIILSSSTRRPAFHGVPKNRVEGFGLFKVRDMSGARDRMERSIRLMGFQSLHGGGDCPVVGTGNQRNGHVQGCEGVNTIVILEGIGAGGEPGQWRRGDHVSKAVAHFRGGDSGLQPSLNCLFGQRGHAVRFSELNPFGPSGFAGRRRLRHAVGKDEVVDPGLHTRCRKNARRHTMDKPT